MNYRYSIVEVSNGCSDLWFSMFRSELHPIDERFVNFSHRTFLGGKCKLQDVIEKERSI